MVSPTAVFQRHKNLNRNSYRETCYTQIFRNLGGGATASLQQPFAGGAIILAVRSSAVLPTTTAAAQTQRNRQLYAIGFAYSAESIVVGAPVMADVLLGGGDGSDFPALEIIVPSNGAITATVVNLVTDVLEVHLLYQALTPKR
jgi:hypothetical protein